MRVARLRVPVQIACDGYAAVGSECDGGGGVAGGTGQDDAGDATGTTTTTAFTISFATTYNHHICVALPPACPPPLSTVTSNQQNWAHITSRVALVACSYSLPKQSSGAFGKLFAELEEREN